jgi:Grx4 family monothiol glutaredoxin
MLLHNVGLFVAVFAFHLFFSDAFTLHLPNVAPAKSIMTARLSDGAGTMVGADEGTQEKIDLLVKSHPVLLFMKGSKIFPQCGFSNNAVQILQSYGIDFHTVDVLADEHIRQGIKVYSQWPTIPQV